MESTFMDYQYPELSTIRINSLGLPITKSPYSSVAVINTLEMIFLPWYIKRY